MIKHFWTFSLLFVWHCSNYVCSDFSLSLSLSPSLFLFLWEKGEIYLIGMWRAMSNWRDLSKQGNGYYTIDQYWPRELNRVNHWRCFSPCVHWKCEPPHPCSSVQLSLYSSVTHVLEGPFPSTHWARPLTCPNSAPLSPPEAVSPAALTLIRAQYTFRTLKTQANPTSETLFRFCI